MFKKGDLVCLTHTRHLAIFLEDGDRFMNPEVNVNDNPCNEIVIPWKIGDCLIFVQGSPKPQPSWKMWLELAE